MAKYLMLPLFLLLSACCTKKDCDTAFRPQINVLLNGFEADDIKDVKLLRIDSNNGEVLDSTNYNYRIKISIASYMEDNNGRDMRNMNYVIQTAAPSSDTISNINYTEKKIRIPCNQCFLGDGSVDAIEYSDFSYSYKGQTLSADTLIVYK